MKVPIRNWLTPTGNNARFLHRKKSQHSHFNIHMLTIGFSFKHLWTDYWDSTEAKDLPLQTSVFAGFRKFQRFHCVPTRSKSRRVPLLGCFVFTHVCRLCNFLCWRGCIVFVFLNKKQNNKEPHNITEMSESLFSGISTCNKHSREKPRAKPGSESCKQKSFQCWHRTSEMSQSLQMVTFRYSIYKLRMCVHLQ